MLAELSPTNQQFTTSLPQVVAVTDASGATAGKWFGVFGSGPTSLVDVKYVSSAAVARPNANIFVYDQAVVRTATAVSTPVHTFTLPAADMDQYIGDPGSADHDIDMKDEVFYVGSVGRPVPPACWSMPTGKPKTSRRSTASSIRPAPGPPFLPR